MRQEKRWFQKYDDFLIMGNTSNRDQWAARERLMFIERLAWWRGAVNRGDLREVFGISAAQASADLQGYLELNPGALGYNLKSKRYEARPEMRCALHEPRLEEALRLFLGAEGPRRWLQAAGGGSGKVGGVDLPVRRAEPEVERRMFVALDQGRRVKVDYRSVRSGRRSWREIAPHALAHDGYRWHVRAWCRENGDYRDFVLSRIAAAEWPGEVFAPERRDEEWERVERVVLRVNPELDEERARALEQDYGMRGGKLVVEVRAAMKEYFLWHVGIPVTDEKGRLRPRHLVLG